MAQFHQAAYANQSFGMSLEVLRPQVFEPLPHGSDAVGIPKEEQPGLRHTLITHHSIANMR